MKRINTPTASSGKFVDGNPSIGRKATQFSAEWCNNVQEELCNAIHALTGADPTGAAEMNELGAALGGIVGKVGTDSTDASPGYLVSKLEGNNNAATGDVVFVEITTQDGKKMKAILLDEKIEAKHIKPSSITGSRIADGTISHSLMGQNAVGGYNLFSGVVSGTNSVAIASGDTKTKVRDLFVVFQGGIFDITAVVKYSGSGYVPSGVSLTVEDADGHVLYTWSIADGESISGTNVKRIVGTETNNVGANGKMLSLYINNGSISYGWSVSVDVDGIVFP